MGRVAGVSGVFNDKFKFLIVGAGRGGTSLLAGLLDYHPGLEVGFELYASAYLMGNKLPYSGPKLLQKRAKTFADACKLHSKNHSQAPWGNKITTEQIYALDTDVRSQVNGDVDVLDTLFNKYLKKRKVVFILRDGRACINSKVKRTGQPLELACERWQYSVECYRFFQTRHAYNVCIKFEDLLLEPRKTLTRVCDFLDIPYTDDMLKGTGNEKMLTDYQSDKLDTSKIKPAELPASCMEQIEDDLKYCGYL